MSLGLKEVPEIPLVPPKKQDSKDSKVIATIIIIALVVIVTVGIYGLSLLRADLSSVVSFISAPFQSPVEEAQPPKNVVANQVVTDTTSETYDNYGGYALKQLDGLWNKPDTIKLVKKQTPIEKEVSELSTKVNGQEDRLISLEKGVGEIQSDLGNLTTLVVENLIPIQDATSTSALP